MAEKVQSGLIMREKGRADVQNDLGIPSPDMGQILIRVHAVALNPSDWMSFDTFARPGAGMGYDFAGEVVEIGPCTGSRWAPEDRVAGFLHACKVTTSLHSHAVNYSLGAFREYVTADADLVIRVPTQMSFIEASTIGMGISTAGQALYQSLGLPLPDANSGLTRPTILIYGGSTATGSLAIQLAKLSRVRVITTCASRNTPWIQSLGPDLVVDYKDPKAIQTIRTLAQNEGLSMILDCVATTDTAAFCYECFVPPPAQPDTRAEYTYSSLMPVKSFPPRPHTIPESSTIFNRWNLVYTCFGRRFNLLGQTWEPARRDRDFMVSFYERVGRILAEKRLRLMPVEVRDGGLEKVLEGIADIRHGKVHGKKLVYPIGQK